MLQLVTLVALSLLVVLAAADEVCESTLLQAHSSRLEEASPAPGITINSTEAEVVTSCPEGADCAAAGNGGCWFGRWRYARDYQCVYVYRRHYNAVEVFYCHDCQLIKCGFSPRAKCQNFHAPDPCAPTTATTTSMTSSAVTTTIVTTATGTTTTTTTTPTTTTIRTSTTTNAASATTTTTTTSNAASATTTTTTSPAVMLWKTSWEYIPGHDVAGCLAVRGSNVVGANCWVDPDCCTDNELWEFTEEGLIVETATQLCLTAVQVELNASDAHDMKTIVKTCDAGDSMQRFVTNSESFTLQLEGDRSLCLDWAARGGFERFETYPVVMRECNNTHSQRWLRVLKVAKLRTSFTDGEESCLSFDNINVEGGACSQAPVWNWRFSTNQLWTKFSDDIPELCLMRIEFVLSIQDVVLAPCDSTKLEQKFTILAERTIHLLEDDGRPGPYLCLDWDVENRYEKDNVYMYYCNDQLNQLWLPIAP